MSQTPRERIAKNVIKYRKQLGYKREELSLMLGCDNSYISKVEKGKINITIDKLTNLARIFNIDISQLLKENAEV